MNTTPIVEIRKSIIGIVKIIPGIIIIPGTTHTIKAHPKRIIGVVTPVKATICIIGIHVIGIAYTHSQKSIIPVTVLIFIVSLVIISLIFLNIHIFVSNRPWTPGRIINIIRCLPCFINSRTATESSYQQNGN
jgi:hypothetical protein